MKKQHEELRQQMLQELAEEYVKKIEMPQTYYKGNNRLRTDQKVLQKHPPCTRETEKLISSKTYHSSKQLCK